MRAFLAQVRFFMILVHFAICGKVAFKVTEGSSDFWTKLIFQDFEKSPIGIGYKILGRQHANHDLFHRFVCCAHCWRQCAPNTAGVNTNSVEIVNAVIPLVLHENRLNL